MTAQHGARTDTVVRAMNDINGKPLFGILQHSNPSTDFQKLWHTDEVNDVTPQASLGSIGSKMAWLRTRGVVAVRRLFYARHYRSARWTDHCH